MSEYLYEDLGFQENIAADYGEDDAEEHFYEDLNQSDELDWLTRTSNAYAQTSVFDPQADDDLVAGVQAVMHIVPAVIRGLNTQPPEAQEAFYELTGLDAGQLDPEDAEAWPAIIGAIASALPSIISAISGLVDRNRSRRPRRPPRPQPTSTPVPRQQTRPINTATPNPHPEEEADDAEAIQFAALIPILVQLLPVLIPLITQVLVPMLTKSLPMITKGISSMAGGKSKKEDMGNPWNELIDGAWEISDAQISTIWDEVDAAVEWDSEPGGARWTEQSESNFAPPHDEYAESNDTLDD